MSAGREYDMLTDRITSREITTISPPVKMLVMFLEHGTWPNWGPFMPLMTDKPDRREKEGKDAPPEYG